MHFPLGKPIALMALVALLAGPAIAFRPTPGRADLTLWLFADLHAQTYRSILRQFEQETGLRVRIELISGRALPVRMQSLFMSDSKDQALPDLVELEIGWVGRFFRPPVDQVGLLPLNDLLERTGWDKRIVESRFTPWSKRGVIFGVPHDVHPVGITFRKDLFDEAGVDLESAKTWPQFQEKCLAFQRFWRDRGYPQRYAIELPQAAADYMIVMLLQRGVNLVDDQDRIHFTDPKVAQTIAFYAQLVAGPRRIASESVTSGTGIWANDVVAGNLCAFMMPDWRVFNLKEYAPQLSGRLRMMPIPRFDAGDAPTATWGGTMLGIPRNSSRHEHAWKLIEFLYLSEAGLKARQHVSNILPPVIAQWDDPEYHRADPFFGSQKVDELYIELAHQLPRRYVSPASNLAEVQLSVLLNRAVAHIREFGEAELEARCRDWCAQAADDLRRRIDHGKIEQ